MTTAITLIVIGFIILLALPWFLEMMIKNRNARKGAKVLCKIFGYLFILWGAWQVISTLIATVLDE
ncbi:MAG: hypothetical protein ACI4SO_06700 [Muribaculaceae bacterium]